MDDSLPVFAAALFFDDIRIEVGGKLSLIGQYVGSMILPEGASPVDRLSLLFYVRFSRGFMPQSLQLKVLVPGQEAIKQDVSVGPGPDRSQMPDSPFSAGIVESVIQMRFSPLRVGDNIDAWVIVDGHELPAGRLHVASHASAEAQTTMAMVG